MGFISPPPKGIGLRVLGKEAVGGRVRERERRETVNENKIEKNKY